MSNNIFLQNQFPSVYQPAVNTQLLPPIQTVPQGPTLNLNQIQGFDPVREFTDSSNAKWQLVKNSSDSTVDIPDPASIQIVDCWCHEFPGLKKNKVYIYVVEGVRLPRVETERPARILYQWFALSFVPTFSHTMISKKEWLKANVYAAPVEDARYSKLFALCKVSGEQKEETPDDGKLITIDVDELSNVGQTSPDDQN